MGVIVYKEKGIPFTSIERIMEHLCLPTVDDTQTALANEDIHISESTAISLRETARLGLTEGELITQKHEQSRCFGRAIQKFKMFFTFKTATTPSEKRT
jgi:hypothetical protein